MLYCAASVGSCARHARQWHSDFDQDNYPDPFDLSSHRNVTGGKPTRPYKHPIYCRNDDPHVRLAIRAWLQHCSNSVPRAACAFSPVALLAVIDECLTEVRSRGESIAQSI